MAKFIDKYKKDHQAVSQTDREIQKYIIEASANDFSKILIKENRWNVFFHLSKLRNALLAWYEFIPKAEILEVAGGFGALTGLLCQNDATVTVTERSTFRAETISKRYKNVKNLSVCAGDLKDIVFDKKFDYIVLTGILELQGNGSAEKQSYIDYLEYVKGLLKPNGKILLSVENRYGLKYFCGEAEPYTKEFFAGINKYPVQGRGYCFDRQELIEIMQSAGISQYKFYYPVPDYKLPQVIYSDNYLPGDEMKERIIPYYNSNSLIASEALLYNDIAKNKVFPFFANSFLVECGITADFCPVDYAAITMDRGLDTSFITSISKKSIVKKQPLYKEGNIGLNQLKENMQALASRNINVVETEYKNDALYMPYIKAPTLAAYLRSLKKEDKEQILTAFDMLWELILQSSEVADELDQDLFQLAPQADWGPVLKTAYMEMIPMNCFFEDGNFIFFDQEFIKENYPAKYPMFRAVAFIHQDLQEIVSLKELQNRYAIDDELWEVFWSVEREFFDGLRNTDLYHQFYMRRENSERIAKNRKIMSLLD